MLVVFVGVRITNAKHGEVPPMHPYHLFKDQVLVLSLRTALHSDLTRVLLNGVPLQLQLCIVPSRIRFLKQSSSNSTQLEDRHA